MKIKKSLLFILTSIALGGCGGYSPSSVASSESAKSSTPISSIPQTSLVSSVLSSSKDISSSELISSSQNLSSSEKASSSETPSSSEHISSSKETSSEPISSSIETKTYYLAYKDSIPSYSTEDAHIFQETLEPGVFYVCYQFLPGDELRVTDGKTQCGEYDLTTDNDNAYLEGLYTVNSRNNIRFNAVGTYYITYDTNKDTDNVFVQIYELNKNSYRIYETGTSSTNWEYLTYKQNKEDLSKLTFYRNNQVYSKLYHISIRLVYKENSETIIKIQSISLGPNTPNTFTLIDDKYIAYSGNTKTTYNVMLYVNTNDLSLTLDFIVQ